MNNRLFVPLAIASLCGGFFASKPTTLAPETISTAPQTSVQTTSKVAERQLAIRLEKALTTGGETWPRTVEKLASDHPQAVASWLATAAFSPQVEMAVQRAAQSWAETAPEKALAWAGTLGHESLQMAAYKGIMARWTQLDANSAWAAAKKLRPEVQNFAAEAWSREDFPKASATTGLRVPLLQNLAPNVPPVAPLQLLTTCTEAELATLGPAPWQHLLNAAPKATLDAWAKLPEDSIQRTSLLTNLAETWAIRDAAGLSAWLQSQPKESVFPAIAVLAGHLQDIDEAASKAWRDLLPQ